MAEVNKRMGRPRKAVPIETTDRTTSKNPPKSLRCCYCGVLLNIGSFYNTKLDIYEGTGVFPFCKSCVDKIYQKYYNEYLSDGLDKPERRAVERVCMMFNVHYSDEIFDIAISNIETGTAKMGSPIIANYFRLANLKQYREKNKVPQTYDTTIKNRVYESRIQIQEERNRSMGIVNIEEDAEIAIKIDKAKKFFGKGFVPDDYVFLQDQYDDWTTRHECQTKSQEEMFKHICYTQLDIEKAKQRGLDTKDLDATFLRQLEAAKLQPKQNKGDTTSEAQTFGTLIEKWETTRPLPEIDEELRDVDKIGLYLDTFFRGHLAKVMGLKNGVSRLYEKYMEKYTVKRPEYSDDEDGEALFDAIFGNSMNDD